jgi:Right handed beta helix region
MPRRLLAAGLAALGVAATACAASGSADERDAARPAPSQLPAPLPPSSGRTFYVAPSGSDSARGTAERPWRTIQKAANTLRPGERALVRAGTYREDLILSRPGTASAPITISAHPGERVVLQPAASEGDTYPVRIRTSFVRLRGFVIELARGTSSTNVYFEGSAHDVELAANEIRYSQDQGIFAESSTRQLHIVRNRIHDNGRGHVSGQHQSHGIYLEGARHLVANNAIYDHPFGFGIQIYPDNHESIVVNNTIVRSGHSGIVVGGDDGVFDITIRNNILAYNRLYGVQMDSDCPTDDVAVDTNLIYGNPRGAVQSGCEAVSTGGGNLSANPRFVARSNFVLKRGSPAVDRARADFAPRTDLRGRRRPSARGYDIGAYEGVASGAG